MWLLGDPGIELDLVAVGAHPDDVEIACGGTLAKLAKLGRSVGIIDLTDGEPTPLSPGPDVRLEEARKAGETLGVAVRVNLNLPNRRLFDNFESRVALAKVFRIHRPKVVLGFGGKTVMASPDHFQAMLITDAAVFYSRLTKWDEYFDGLPVHGISNQLGFPISMHGMETPECSGVVIADISATLEIKLRSIRCYETQFPPTKSGLFRTLEAMNRYHGATAGFDAGEQFLTYRAVGVDDLYEWAKRKTAPAPAGRGEGDALDGNVHRTIEVTIGGSEVRGNLGLVEATLRRSPIGSKPRDAGRRLPRDGRPRRIDLEAQIRLSLDRRRLSRAQRRQLPHPRAGPRRMPASRAREGEETTTPLLISSPRPTPPTGCSSSRTAWEDKMPANRPAKWPWRSSPKSSSAACPGTAASKPKPSSRPSRKQWPRRIKIYSRYRIFRLNIQIWAPPPWSACFATTRRLWPVWAIRGFTDTARGSSSSSPRTIRSPTRLVDAGTISLEELENHRFKHVLYLYLGSKEARSGPDEVTVVDIQIGDRFLLASDGLTGVVRDAEIGSILSTGDDPQHAAEALVDRARKNVSRDNITCIVIHINEGK